MRKLSKLIENDLDQAELVLAAKSMAQDLQDMTEKVAKMRVDDVMPLVDRIKSTFDLQTGERYQQVVDAELEKLQDELTASKDVVDNQASILNGDMPPDDAGLGGMDMGMDDDPMGMDMEMDPDAVSRDIDPELDLDVDPFGGDDAGAGGVAPMGRSARESVRRKGKMIAERIQKIEKKLQKLKTK